MHSTVAARHDPHEAHTHLLQAAAGDSVISVQAPTRISARTPSQPSPIFA